MGIVLNRLVGINNRKCFNYINNLNLNQIKLRENKLRKYNKIARILITLII